MYNLLKIKEYPEGERYMVEKWEPGQGNFPILGETQRYFYQFGHLDPLLKLENQAGPKNFIFH